MKIELRKIKISYYSDLLNSINDNMDYYLDHNVTELNIDGQKKSLEEISEPFINSEKLEIDIDPEDLKFNGAKWKENYLLGKILHRKLLNYDSKYYGCISEPYFWAYLAHHQLFRQYISKRFLNRTDEEDIEEPSSNIEKIKRYFFFKGQLSRTGIMFYWALTNCLYNQKKQYELSEVAFSFIDSVKAIYERSFRKNKLIVQAFVQGIINNSKSSVFKNHDYRNIIPTHISNIASLNILDSYDSFNDLVYKITEEQRKLIKLYESTSKKTGENNE